MEKNHSEVQEKIQEVEKQKISNEEELKKSRERLSKANPRLLEIKADIAALREQKQYALAKGEDAVAGQVNKKLRDAEEESELKADEIAGLKTHISKLEQESQTLTYETKRLSIRTLVFRTVALAAEYNKLAAQLAAIVREFNETNWEIQRESGPASGNSLAVFVLKEGAIERIPKILFDEDGPNLEEFVARHPGFYPSNLKPADRCFYDYDTHHQDMIQGRTL